MDALNPNVAARLIERAARHPERPAIIEYRRGRSRRVIFGELAGGVQRLAAGLEARGIGPGDRILLFLPMSIDLYTALLACLHLGATVVFVDAWADRRRLDAAVAAAAPRAFLGTPKAHLLRLVSTAIRGIPIQLVAGRSAWPLLRYARAAAPPAAQVAPEAPALITLTTGSTGRPKAAARSHAFLWAQHEALATHLGLTERDVDMPTLPIFVLNNLATGTPSVLPDFDPRHPAQIDPAAVYRQILAEGVTTSSGSPAFYQRLAGWCAASGRQLPLRALFTGGAPVLPPLARLLADTVAGEAHVVYGSTEAEPIAGIAVREMLAAMADGEARANGSHPEGICVGHPVPEVALRLIWPCDGAVVLGPGGWAEWEVPPGEVGEVVVTGSHVLSGYLNDPEAERLHKIRDGERVWHRTGDAARLDAEGRLWLMGRVRERVQRAGQLWWGTAAEVRTLAVEGITHAAYLGIRDAALGQCAVLCVETSSGSLAASAEDRLRSALAPLPVDEIRALRRIPRDPRHASKTDMEALRRLVTG